MIRFTKLVSMPRALSLFMVSIFLVAAMLLFQSSTPVVAQEHIGLNEAIMLHNKARDGEEEAAEKAVSALKILLEKEPDNAKVYAYLGSAYSISARDAGSVTDKIRFTNRGLRYLDEAIDMAPRGFIVRLIRANVTQRLPAMFGREKSAHDDMLVLDQMYTMANHPSMARPMIAIYQALVQIAPNQGDWIAKAVAASKASTEH